VQREDDPDAQGKQTHGFTLFLGGITDVHITSLISRLALKSSVDMVVRYVVEKKQHSCEQNVDTRHLAINLVRITL
jgi:hypothetical protein